VSWIFWIGALVFISLVFWRMWKFAERIEHEEAEEEAWKQYIASLWHTHPHWATYYQAQFEARFLR